MSYFIFYSQKTTVSFSPQEIVDLGIDIGVEKETDEKEEVEKNDTKEKLSKDNHNKDQYHLQVQNEDLEDLASLATSTSFERSSFRYSLRKTSSKRSINVKIFSINF